MAKFIKEYDFHKILLPHGEDNISFFYENGDFTILATYDDVKKLKLLFLGCSYQAFHPIPGAAFVSTNLDYWGGEAGCVYSIEGLNIISECAEIRNIFSWTFSKKYFYCRFDSCNVGFHIIADKFEYEMPSGHVL